MSQKKVLKKFKVNASIKINFPIYVLAEDEDEAISLCEDNICENDVEIFSDTVGLRVPYRCMDDDDETDIFEQIDYDMETFSDFDFEIDNYEKPEEVELEYTDEEEDEDDDEIE